MYSILYLCRYLRDKIVYKCVDQPIFEIGCMGSEPKYRGYPCSLWQLFHTITVNAAKDDGSNQFSELSSTIVDYVQHFFQCRHCAKNFLLKVQSISQGALPKKPKDIMMWLWRIHNMANVKLAGMLD